ncbi:MAG: PorT family protein [Chlorobi bacterium]|nr:PorT family protein [Chlorobiota bacterium]
MNKTTGIIIFFVLISSVLNAQDKEPFVPEHLFGFTAGINMTSIFHEENLTYTDKNGNLIVKDKLIQRYSGGISYKYISSKNVGILLELTYNQKGGYNEFMFDLNGNVTDSTLFNHELDYLEFSFLTDIRMGKKHGKINLYVGPHISYLLKDKIIFMENTYGHEYADKADYNIAGGINGGIGYSYNFNKGELELRFIFNQDFTNIFKEKTVNNFSFNENQTLSFTVSYYYKTIKK